MPFFETSKRDADIHLIVWAETAHDAHVRATYDLADDENHGYTNGGGCWDADCCGETWYDLRDAAPMSAERAASREAQLLARGDRVSVLLEAPDDNDDNG